MHIRELSIASYSFYDFSNAETIHRVSSYKCDPIAISRTVWFRSVLPIGKCFKKGEKKKNLDTCCEPLTHLVYSFMLRELNKRIIAGIYYPIAFIIVVK